MLHAVCEYFCLYYRHCTLSCIQPSCLATIKENFKRCVRQIQEAPCCCGTNYATLAAAADHNNFYGKNLICNYFIRRPELLLSDVSAGAAQLNINKQNNFHPRPSLHSAFCTLGEYFGFCLHRSKISIADCCNYLSAIISA